MRALGSCLALVLAAGLLYALQKTTPGYSTITSPIVSAGAQGERVATPAFAVTARRVYLAREVTVEAFGRTKTYSSSGVWIVVEAEAEALRESLSLTFANWQAPDGIRYALSPRLSAVPGYLPVERLEPGLPRPVLMAFEAPQGAIAGGHVILARNALFPLGDQLDIRMEAGEVPIVPRLTIRRSSGGAGWTLDPQ